MSKAQHDSETPAEGQQVISAVAFIHRKVSGTVQVYLARRANSKKFLPGKYELLGGHIDFGELLEDGIKREIKEELEAEVTVGDAFFAFTYENKIKGSHTVEIVYFAQFSSDPDKIKLNSEDHSEAGWFSREVLSTMKSEVVADDHPQSMDLDGQEDPEWLAIMKGFDILEKNDWDKGGS